MLRRARKAHGPCPLTGGSGWLVNSAWRNTSVENWHAEGRLHDGEMLRINSHSTWRIRQILLRWRAEMGLVSGAPTQSLEAIEFDDFRRLGGRIYQWIVNPRHRLPTGDLLADVAQDGLSDLEHDADSALTAFVYQAEDRGVAFSFRRAAAHGGLACPHWWGHHATFVQPGRTMPTGRRGGGLRHPTADMALSARRPSP